QCLKQEQFVMAGHQVNSPMTGQVIEVSVEIGQSISVGDLLIVIESMKMENEIFSEVNGTITSIEVTEDQNVSEENLLMTIEI
ncbi:MAG: acetyl-CoA carboxylase biotin carboxyl carrier protein subunit, partial [Chloroflexota bacterium]|nr:acetyl-CoA carboxylase biotin carboxyl carrier protein subunit [Chloroflexota bacterium]